MHGAVKAGMTSSGSGVVLVSLGSGNRLEENLRLQVCEAEPVRGGPLPCPGTIDHVHFDLGYSKPRYRGRVRITLRQYDSAGFERWKASRIFRVRKGDLFGHLNGPGEAEAGDWFEITFSLLEPRLMKLRAGDRAWYGAEANAR